jgi:hypothetical protein
VPRQPSSRDGAGQWQPTNRNRGCRASVAALPCQGVTFLRRIAQTPRYPQALYHPTTAPWIPAPRGACRWPVPASPDPDPMPTESSSLADYVSVLRRGKWLILQALILVPALALLLSLRQAATYEATTQVTIERQGISDGVTSPSQPLSSDQLTQLLRQESALARSADVASRVARTTGGRVSTAEALAQTSVQPDAGTGLLVFRAKGEDPQLASVLAPSYAEAYLASRRAFATNRYRQAIAEIDRRLASIPRGGSARAIAGRAAPAPRGPARARVVAGLYCHGHSRRADRPAAAAQRRPRHPPRSRARGGARLRRPRLRRQGASARGGCGDPSGPDPRADPQRPQAAAKLPSAGHGAAGRR